MIWTVWCVISILLFRFGIKLFQQMQIRQSIYEDGPEQHQKKRGTPTMGGVIIYGVFLLGLVFLYNFQFIFLWNVKLIWILLATTLFFMIGVIDDVKSLKNKKNKGLSAKGKFGMQILAAVILIILLHQFIQPISFVEGLLFIFLLTGTSNATNLTDGVDGLLAGTMVVSLLGVVHVLFELWLFEEVYIVILLISSLLIFLLFNWNPAKIFMGDSGSLMLGAFLAATCIIIGKWWMLVGFGAMYVVETLSVMIQVISFKLTGRRVFLMTPLHHHFELMGISEVLVVVIFVIFQAVFTLIQVI